MVGFYAISTIVRYLMPNPLYTYILLYMICKHISLITLLNKPKLILLHTNISQYCNVTIQLDISHLFTLLNHRTVLFQTIQFSISIKLKGS